MPHNPSDAVHCLAHHHHTRGSHSLEPFAFLKSANGTLPGLDRHRSRGPCCTLQSTRSRPTPPAPAPFPSCLWPPRRPHRRAERQPLPRAGPHPHPALSSQPPRRAAPPPRPLRPARPRLPRRRPPPLRPPPPAARRLYFLCFVYLFFFLAASRGSVVRFSPFSPLPGRRASAPP